MKNAGMLVFGNDQLTEEMELFDLSLLKKGDDLMDAKIWSVPSGHAAGMKYRENTVFGDVFLIAGSISSMISYPSGRVLWSTDRPGNNTHSVEILPSGNIVLANSHGNDIRLFYTSALLAGDAEKAGEFVSYPFGCTHGVLYDPVYECLWVIGEWELAAYRIVGEGASQTLEPIEGRKWSLAEYGNSGHDLSPDLTDSRYLFCTPAAGVLRFDKERGTFDRFFADGTPLQSIHYKSFTQAPDGTFFFTEPNHGKGRSWENWRKASWLTDRIFRAFPDENGVLQVEEYETERGAFYKCRAFCGRYL